MCESEYDFQPYENIRIKKFNWRMHLFSSQIFYVTSDYVNGRNGCIVAFERSIIIIILGQQ